MKLSAKQFINKYGTDGLLQAIGDKTKGFIARGNDYACVAGLLEILK